MVHFSLYDTYPDTVSCHDTICYITTKQEGYCLMSCSWAQRSVQLPSVCVHHLEYNAKHCSVWIFLVGLFRKSPFIRTKKWKEGEH